MIERFKGQVTGNGFAAECVITPNPRGGWYLEEAPSNLPPGVYALTFGDRNGENPSGIYKKGLARRALNGQWNVEDVEDA